MCGICGAIDNNVNATINDSLLFNMCAAMAHRGPDDEGVYTNSSSEPFVGLGHRRLKIIDLSSSGHQPMSNEDGTVWIVFNGEVYNYRDLRRGLQEKGHSFKSHTDTETVIHLYEEYGRDCVKFLSGMFAFAIWDSKGQSLLLARDRVGKKPLIYSFKDGIFCFASEFLSLLSSGAVKKEVNYDSVNYYFSFGYIPAPLTIYKNVFKLLPAHTLVFKNGKIDICRYWGLDYDRKIVISEDEAAEETLKLLREAVKIRLYSDVPLGAFLSGGVDSSTVVALMSQLSQEKVKTFSIGFREEGYSELKYAGNIAKRFATEHHEFIVKPKALEILPLLVERYGEPYADSSCIPTYYVAQETKKYVTVALNGDGGDELFAGYERYPAMLIAEIYKGFPDIAKKIISGFLFLLPVSVNPRNRMRNIKRFFEAANLPRQQRYLRWVSIFSPELKISLYSDEFKNKVSDKDSAAWLEPFLYGSNKLNLLDRLLMADTHTYLPNDLLVKMDITSMANSLEARSPFLDHKLMEFAASLPAEYKIKGLVKKYILKKAIKGLVPAQNIHRRKMGFGMPVGEWFRQDLKGILYETLLSKQFINRGYFKHDKVKNMIKEHIERHADYTFQLWALLMFELWHRRFID